MHIRNGKFHVESSGVRSRGMFLLISRALLVLIVSAALTACAYREHAIIGAKDADLTASDVQGTKRHDIYVMTTRQPSADPARMYSGKRSRTLDFAKVTVTIPPGHQPGQIERPKRLPPDARREMTVVDPVKYASQDDITADMNRAIRSDGTRASILVFVHGYNTTFTDAVLRLGQFVEDSGFEGIPVLFTWASAGKLTDYVYDINSALSARNALLEASEVMKSTNAHSINIMAHSMGNFLTVEAMRQARLQNRFNSSGKVRNIVLASADIDVDVFAEQMSAFDPSERKFYVLVSEDDKALATSRFLARGVNRVGDADTEQLEALGVTVIDLTTVSDRESSNHSKFANSPEVVRIIGGRMLKGDSIHPSPVEPGVLAGIFASLNSVTQSILSPGN